MNKARRTLVIDTATAACSVALIADGAVIARAHDVVGRGHAERLVPMIATLPDGGRATDIMVDVGPGSFTGIRVGIAAARGLALGWGASVTGYSSLALLAAAALTRRPVPAIAVVLEGGHGEVFVQSFDATAAPMGELASLTPQTALEAVGDTPIVGNGVRWLTALAAGIDATEALPDAADATRLDPEQATLLPRPLYGRPPDAKVPA